MARKTAVSIKILTKKARNGRRKTAFISGAIRAKIMRIDKFLKVSRILKRRTVAREACDGGKVIINGREVKPSHQIKVGDVVEIDYAADVLKFKILEIKETVKKDEASSLYEIL